MPRPYSLKISDIFTISGAQIPAIYVDNKMTVHFQGMSKTMQFPQTIALQGAPTCSIGISPDGLYNRLNDAGRLVFLYQKAIQFASAPFIRIGDKTVSLTTKKPQAIESPDDIPVSERYYHSPVSYGQVSISIATPLLEMAYKLGKVRVIRRMISPFLSGNTQALMPIGVEEYEVENTTNQVQQITLVIPRPSLANLQEKKYRPIDQDSAFICATPVKGHVHEDFRYAAIRGVVMGSKECQDRMVIAVPEKIKGATVDTQPYFKLNSLKQDLLLSADGSFYSKIEQKDHNDYGAAISIAFTLKPKAKIKIPVVIALDFPIQWYADNTKFERKYVKSFKNKKTRAKDMAKIALDNYPKWQSRTAAIQNRIFELIRQNPSYKNDRAGALLLTRLILNEFHFPLSNAAAWIEDKKGDVARFLECFDYPYVNSQDVDWFSPILLMLFPKVEKEICQRFIDSIMEENLTERYYHFHASFAEARKHFEDYPEEYEGQSLTHIKAATKIKGSVSHDLTALTFGNPMRNKSEYAWYNTNYWIDLFPKLALRVLRNVKYTGDTVFLKDNWKTLKFGFEYLEKLDLDGDGIPEGNPDEVKNTFDNIPLFGIDSYSTNGFLAACKAMIRMAEMMKDSKAKKEYEEIFEKGSAVYERLWIDTKNSHGRRIQYYATCVDLATGQTNSDVWTNQLDGLWYLIAMGEEPFIPEDKVKKILKTIYENNRTPMGWATARTQNGKQVESDQGKDVWIASNYILAQLLDYYGLIKESKEVYKVMDKVVFQHANSLISPESVRPTFEKEAGELTKGPHYIVAGYTRPGAIFAQLPILFVKELQKRMDTTKIDSQLLKSFVTTLMKK